MRQMRHGVRSTKERVIIPNNNDEKVPRRKQHKIYVRVEQVKDMIYTEQTENPQSRL